MKPTPRLPAVPKPTRRLSAGRVVRIGPHVLYLGDCREVLPTLAAESVDAVVTDPPYGLSFMGKKWDYDVPRADVWRVVLDAAKPGAHLLCFAGTRTQHRMACAIEDAGFEIRDVVAWLYGQGFPKSLNISKGIDDAVGAERRVLGRNPNDRSRRENRLRDFGLAGGVGRGYLTAPATDEAKQWDGWGTALKPAMEPVTVARKPLVGTVVQNVLRYGTGGLNVDGCRVRTGGPSPSLARRLGARPGRSEGASGWTTPPRPPAHSMLRPGEMSGRWPANVILDEEAGAMLDAQTGGASRFFYCPKASAIERDGGLDGVKPDVPGEITGGRKEGSAVPDGPRAGGERTRGVRNTHPTVKPLALMRYLCRLVTPPGGIVLDPFMGSGTTGMAAVKEGFRFIGIELDPTYFGIACRRMDAVLRGVL